MLNNLGFDSPEVYIHTGNWVFKLLLTEQDLQIKISKAIFDSYGWEVPVVVVSAISFQKIFASCPFPIEKKEKSYFTILAEIPSEENQATFNKISFPEEEFVIDGACVYFYSTISAGRVKMNNNFIEKKLKVSATSRNYKTMHKLMILANC